MYVFRELLKTKLNEPQFNYFIICCPRCPATDSIVCSLFRVTLLELISAQLNEEGSDNCGVPPAVAHFLAGSFQKGCGAVLTLATGSISSDEVRTVREAGSDSSPSVCIVVFFAFPGGSVRVLAPVALSMNLPACCDSPSGPAGGADCDQSAGCPVWNDLGPQAVYVPAGLPRPSRDHRGWVETLWGWITILFPWNVMIVK